MVAKTHGKSRTQLYWVWQSMKSRCYNKNNKSYARYGAKGITVCKEWLDSFEQFCRDVGERDKGMTLDRIDSTKGYEPKNVRWATYTQQARNTKRNVFVYVENKKMTLTEACLFLGLNYESTRVALKKSNFVKGIKNA